MKIGIICYPTYGGSGVVATELALALAAKGHEMHIISYAMPIRLDKFTKNVFYHEVEIAQYPVLEFPLYTTALASKIIEVHKNINLDLVHAHYAIPHATSAYLAKEIIGKNLKIITTLHGTDITLVGLEPSFSPVMTFSINNSDGITSVSNYLKNETINNYEIKKDIKVIYNFIDVLKYKRKVNNSLKKVFAPKNEKLIIHNSNFRNVKNVPFLINSFKFINNEIPSKLILIGDGPEKNQCEKLASELGIENNIYFLGKQSEIINILSIGDVFVLPSKIESFGLSALEAMSCEVPIVTSNVGGLPELNINGKTGFTFKDGNSNEMTEAILNILTNKKLNLQLGLSARKHAIDNFSQDKIVDQYEEFYIEITG